MRLRKPLKHEALSRNSGELVPISTCWDALASCEAVAVRTGLINKLSHESVSFVAVPPRSPRAHQNNLRKEMLAFFPS